MKIRIAFGIKLAILIMITIILVYPLFMVVNTSLKTQEEYLKDRVGLPDTPRFETYSEVYNKANIPRAMRNSFTIMLMSVAGQLFIGSLAAYAITKMGLRNSDNWARMFLTPMAFSAQIVIVPLFTMFNVLQLLNTLPSVVLIFIAKGLPLTIYLLSKFMMTVPSALTEAARIDGANHFSIYSRIILPLSKVPIMTLIVINGMYVWNDFFVPFMFLQKDTLQTLPQTLIVFQSAWSTHWPEVAALTVYTIAPMFAIYLFFQKYIITGVGAGAVKG